MRAVSDGLLGSGAVKGVDANADVVVVGAGPAGCVASLLLAAQGRRVTVLEQSPGAGGAGAGIMVQPNGLAVLQGLDLAETLRGRGKAIRSVVIYDDHGRVLVETPLPDFGSGLDHALVVRRQHLASVLDHAMGTEGRIDVLRGTTLVSANGDGVVTYDTGTERRRMRALLVIGADGIGSEVRRTGQFRSRPVQSGHVYVRTIVDAETDLPTGECWSRLGLFGSAPLGDGATYAYASAGDPRVQAALVAKDLDTFVGLWSAALPAAAPLLDRLTSTDDLLVNEVGTVRCGTYVDGRSVLIGDAAHAMAPNLGQGANSALVDAAVLGAELAGAADQAAGLSAYDRSRRRAVGKVQRDAQRLARMAHLRGRLARVLRDRAMVALGHPALMDRQIRATQQVDPARIYDLVRGQRP